MRANLKTLAALLLVGATACTSGGGTTGDDDVVGDDDGDDTEVDEWDEKLEEREVDYSASLLIAALRLTGELPMLVEVKALAEAPDAQNEAVYESFVRGYLADPRFARQMYAWWKDTLKTGDTPELDTAA